MNYTTIIKHLPHFINNRLYWDRISPYYSPKNMTPDWPTLDECKNYFKIIEGMKSKGSVLILGATPFLRKLTRGYKTRYVADHSEKMLEAMEKHLSSKLTRGEIIINDNWFSLEKKIPPGFLDLIAGDLVINQLPFGVETEFLRIIHKLLKPGGHFVTRVQVKNPSFRDTNGVDIIMACTRRINDGPIRSTLPLLFADKMGDDRFIAKGSEIVRAIELSAEELENTKSFYKKNNMDKNEIMFHFEILLNSRASDPVRTVLRENVVALLKTTNPGILCLPQEYLESKFKDLFSIKTTRDTKNYFGSNYFPIFELGETV